MNSLIYIVVLEDRHIDAQLEAFTDRAKAIARARELAGSYLDPRDLLEENTDPTWEVHLTYSCEGDRVWVKEVALT